MPLACYLPAGSPSPLAATDFLRLTSSWLILLSSLREILTGAVAVLLPAPASAEPDTSGCSTLLLFRVLEVVLVVVVVVVLDISV